MATTDKESSAVGTNNRPPISIQNGPTPHPQITVTEGQGAAAVQVTRDKTDEEFTEIENNRELADIQATNILSQGIPRHVFNILNQTRTGKEIWDNVELLMKAAQSSNDAMLATMNQIVNLLSGFQKQFPLTNNQLKTSSTLRSHATVHDRQIVTETVYRKASSNVGHVSRQCKEKKRVKDSQHFKDKMLLIEAKEKGAVLDAESEAFFADVECTAPYDKPLAITTTNNFKVSHEDAYDSNVYEGTHAAAAFMANLSSISGTNSATTSHVNEEQSMVNDSLRAELARCKLEIQTLERNKVKHDLDTTIVQRNKQNAKLEQENINGLCLNLQKSTKNRTISAQDQKLQRKAGSGSKFSSNKLTLKLNLSKIQSSGTSSAQRSKPNPSKIKDKSPGAKYDNIAQPTLYDGHALLKPTNTPVRVHDSEESLVQAEKELSREQVYWLLAEELATQKSNPPKPVTLFVHTCPAPSKVRTQLLKLKDCFSAFETIIKRRTTPTFHEQGKWRFVHNKKAFTEQVIPFYEHVKELVQNLDENLVKEVTEFMC
nr:hypothetical protein [Tanacetum cinerariifolium]